MVGRGWREAPTHLLRVWSTWLVSETPHRAGPGCDLPRYLAQKFFKPYLNGGIRRMVSSIGDPQAPREGNFQNICLVVIKLRHL